MDVTLVDHERRIRLLERFDAYTLRVLGGLVLLKFMGVDNLWQVITFFQGLPRAAH